MELNQLRYFYEAARLEHITRAANALGVAQPAITLSVHRLEKELGVKLFRRCGRGVILTECGKYLYEKLGSVFKALDTIPEDVRHIANFEKDTVNINLLAASTLLTDIIIEYKKKNPDVTFRISQQTGTGGSDIIVRNEPGEVNADSKEAFTLYEKIYIAVPFDSPLAKNKSIRLEDVRDEGFISLAGSKHFRAMCDLFCSSAGFAPKIVFESDDPYTVKNLIATGMGVGFWPEFSWGKLDGSEVKLISISYPECSRTLIVEKTDNRETEAVDNFFEYAKNSLSKIGK